MKDKRLIYILIVLAIGWFYWFQIRPARIREQREVYIMEARAECHTVSEKNAIALEKSKLSLYEGTYTYNLRKQVVEKKLYNPEVYEGYYKKCLRQLGIE